MVAVSHSDFVYAFVPLAVSEKKDLSFNGNCNDAADFDKFIRAYPVRFRRDGKGVSSDLYASKHAFFLDCVEG